MIFSDSTTDNLFDVISQTLNSNTKWVQLMKVRLPGQRLAGAAPRSVGDILRL